MRYSKITFGHGFVGSNEAGYDNFFTLGREVTEIADGAHGTVVISRTGKPQLKVWPPGGTTATCIEEDGSTNGKATGGAGASPAKR